MAGENPAQIVSDLTELPLVKSGWLYRGHIHLAVRVEHLKTIRRMLTGRWEVIETMGSTATIRSGWQTTEAFVKQAEAKMRYESYPIEEGRLIHLLHLLATYANDDLTKFTEVHGRPDSKKFREYIKKRYPGITFPQVYEQFYGKEIPEMNCKSTKDELKEIRDRENNRITSGNHTLITNDYHTEHTTSTEKEDIENQLEQDYLDRKENPRSVMPGHTGFIYPDERFLRNNNRIRQVVKFDAIHGWESLPKILGALP